MALSIGDCDDALEDCALYGSSAWLATRFAYKDDEIRSLAMELGYIPVVPSKSNRRNPQDYDKQLYRQRNQVEKLFRCIKRFRRILPAMINLILSVWPISISLLLLMHLCKQILLYHKLAHLNRRNSQTGTARGFLVWLFCPFIDNIHKKASFIHVQ